MATLGELVANVRRNLGESSEQFYTDAELKQVIGEAYRRYAIYLINNGDGYFETTVNLSITAGDPVIPTSALDPVFYQVSALEKRTSVGTYPLRMNERRFKANSTFVVGSGDSYRPTWKLRSNNVILEPTPQTSEVAGDASGLKLDYYYIPIIPVFNSLNTFTFDSSFPTIWEPAVEVYATIAALESKDGMGGVSDINSFRNRLNDWDLNITNALSRSEYPDEVDYAGLDYDNIDK